MNTSIVQSPPAETSGAWAHVFATAYDPLLWLGERAGMRALRRDLLRRAQGRTVDVGSGTGLNLPYYPGSLDQLFLAEPDPAMRRRLDKRLRQSRRKAELIDAPAEQLPFADESIDTVVCTLVLCTVDAPELALQEIRRVLRPDGQLLFVEHVRSESARLAAWQDRLENPWRHFARGCRCNRATGPLIASSGFTVTEMHEHPWHVMPPIVRPLITGRALREQR